MKIDNKKQIVVSFSGGRTSGYMCYLTKKLYPDAVYVFCDTGAEHHATYDFVRRCNDYFDLNLVCLRAKVTHERGVGNTYKVVDINDIGHDLEPFFESSKKYSTPTIAGPKCTDRLKSTPSDKWCNDTFGKGGWVKFLGMRADEPNRLKDIKNQVDLFNDVSNDPRSFYYLAEISSFTKQDVLDWWSVQPFDLQIEEHLGNCVFCIKKGAAKLALAARQEPELAKAWIEMCNSDEIPAKPNKKIIANDIMYRNHHSLQTIISSFSDYSEAELEQRIYKTGGGDSGSCSESCEAILPILDEVER